MLARKAGKKTTWIEPIVDLEAKTIKYKVRKGGVAPDGLVGRQGGVCLATGANISLNYIREEGKAGRHGVALMAIVCEGQSGRQYVEPQLKDTPIVDFEKPSLGTIPNNPRDFKTPNYGMVNW